MLSSDPDREPYRDSTRRTLSPGLGVDLTQLDLITDESRVLAVHFRPLDMDLKRAGGDLDKVSAGSDIGKVRDACRARGLELFLDRNSTDIVTGRIVCASLFSQTATSTSSVAPKLHFCNVFTNDVPGLEIRDQNEYPCFLVRSFGVGCVDVSVSPEFKNYLDAERFIEQQWNAGYRGWPMIQASYPGRGCVILPFVAEARATDTGIEWNRDDFARIQPTELRMQQYSGAQHTAFFSLFFSKWEKQVTYNQYTRVNTTPFYQADHEMTSERFMAAISDKATLSVITRPRIGDRGNTPDIIEISVSDVSLQEGSDVLHEARVKLTLSDDVVELAKRSFHDAYAVDLIVALEDSLRV